MAVTLTLMGQVGEVDGAWPSLAVHLPSIYTIHAGSRTMAYAPKGPHLAREFEYRGEQVGINVE